MTPALWKIGGGLVILAAAYFLVTLYGKARYEDGQADERVAWQDRVVAAEREKLQAFQDGMAKRQFAETRYVETVRTLPPVTNTIVERATTYASTPDGASQCLSAERVRGLDQSRAALFPATPAADPGRAP